jgi:hypothetical protein
MEKDKIKWKKCDSCGFLQHDSHVRCLKCKKTNFSKITAPETCKLLTYTILKAPPKEFREQGSYALGVVEFENGQKVLGQITTQDDLKIGMKLTPIYKKLCNDLDGHEIFTHVFKPYN